MESYRILILGSSRWEHNKDDTHVTSAHEHSPQWSSATLSVFREAADAVILNLEAPLVDTSGSSLSSTKRGGELRSADSTITTSILEKLGVDAVGLANAHVFDRGKKGLESTFRTLSDRGIGWFGAGRNLDQAQAPYRLHLPQRVGGGEVWLHGSLQFSSRLAKDRSIYADDESPGCAALRTSIPPARHDDTPEDSFHIALPSWGMSGEWRNQKQFQLAHRFLKKDYNLVLGTGSHRVQEVHRKQQRWVVYGIGNGIVPAGVQQQVPPGEAEAFPCDFWAMFEVHRQGRQRWATLKLYPVISGTPADSTKPRPVRSEEFDRLMKTLTSRPARPWRFDNTAQSTGTDQLGHFIALDLGQWPENKRPTRLNPTVEGGDPGDWPLRAPSPDVEEQLLQLRKHIGPSMLALGATADGGSARWLTYDLVLLSLGKKRMLACSYFVNDSSLGGTLVEDKVLTAEFLKSAGVPTPKTILVNTADEAVKAAEAIPGPVVVKPRYGVKSNGVSTDLGSEREIREAFVFAREHGSEVILQPHIEMAEELRVMASPDRAVAVNGRALPHVIGDGVSTVRQLIEDKNLQRTLNPSLTGRPIPIDALTHRQLKRIGLTVDSVPELGQAITVRRVAGLSVGGDTIQLLEETSFQIKAVASAAIKAIPGLDWGGVDLLVEKNTGNVFVLEINANAAYGAAMFPAYGQPRDVSAEAWALRRSTADPDPDIIPATLDPNSIPTAMVSEPHLARANGKASFKRLFRDSLDRQNYQITHKNPYILELTTPDGDTKLVTAGGLNSADRSAIQRVLRRPLWVSRLLKISGVTRARGRVVRSTPELRAFVESQSAGVTLVGFKTSWAASSNRVLSQKQALKITSVPRPVWVQARLEGHRVRVLATRERSWVLTTDAREQPLSREVIAAAGKAAVEAVRAIPELRWAAVDLVLRIKRIEDGRSGGIVTEGLTNRPVYSVHDQVIAGDFDMFCHWLVDTAC